MDETKEDLRKREIQNAELMEQFNRMVSRSKALIYLVKKDVINLPEIQVIRSLKVPGVDNEENLNLFRDNRFHFSLLKDPGI